MRVLISSHSCQHVILWKKIVFDYSYLHGCEIASHCGFDLHFPNDQWCWGSFYKLIVHLYILFEEVSIQATLCLIFKSGCFLFLLSYRSSLYILDSTSSDIWLVIIFSHSMCWLFTLLWSKTPNNFVYIHCFWFLSSYFSPKLTLSSLYSIILSKWVLLVSPKIFVLPSRMFSSQFLC